MAKRVGYMTRIFQNFMNSITKGRQMDSRAKLVGQDFLGNKYFEIPADPSIGRRRARRWFTTSELEAKHIENDSSHGEGAIGAEVPSDWESWLRHRRHDPPTERQVLQAYALADLKKRNAAELERKRIAELKADGRYVGPAQPQDHEKPFYPKYDEYEILPGEISQSENRGDRWKDYKNPYLSPEEDQTTKKSKK